MRCCVHAAEGGNRSLRRIYPVGCCTLLLMAQLRFLNFVCLFTTITLTLQSSHSRLCSLKFQHGPVAHASGLFRLSSISKPRETTFVLVPVCRAIGRAHFAVSAWPAAARLVVSQWLHGKVSQRCRTLQECFHSEFAAGSRCSIIRLLGRTSHEV